MEGNVHVTEWKKSWLKVENRHTARTTQNLPGVEAHTPVPRRLRLEDCESEANLGYIEKACLTK